MSYDIQETIVIDKDYTNTANIMHDIQTGLEINDHNDKQSQDIKPDQEPDTKAGQ